jgi:hypothetical protein
MISATLPPPTSRAGTILRDSMHAELHRLEVTETFDEVIITGDVPSYYLKSLAQETVKPHLGERQLRNRVVVNK